jgi:hypothetical protein
MAYLGLLLLSITGLIRELNAPGFLIQAPMTAARGENEIH